jgi:hypothetical protein
MTEPLLSPSILARLSSTEAARLRRLLRRLSPCRWTRAARRFCAVAPGPGRGPWEIHHAP